MRKQLIFIFSIILIGISLLSYSKPEGSMEEFYNNVGIEMLKKRDFKSALSNFDDAIKENRIGARGYYNMACTYSLMNNKQKAIDYLLFVKYLDEKWLKKALRDKDFNKIRNSKEFKSLFIKKKPKLNKDQYLKFLSTIMGSAETYISIITSYTSDNNDENIIYLKQLDKKINVYGFYNTKHIIEYGDYLYDQMKKRNPAEAEEFMNRLTAYD